MEFKLTEKEEQAAKEFMKEHKHDLRTAGFSTLGMQFTYHITPGGLGNGVEIECNACKDKKDITDITGW